ncbi:unnamed protein product [Pleuronectes platessa]|uniref:Uncharacterized protein n=1 Tax=Pleuronectes platessa TaxID=8262 RepID=A0A9N7VWI4_PLEPL|nr:unnamed protein product [Pleuronectes platessa]
MQGNRCLHNPGAWLSLLETTNELARNKALKQQEGLGHQPEPICQTRHATPRRPGPSIRFGRGTGSNMILDNESPGARASSCNRRHMAAGERGGLLGGFRATIPALPVRQAKSAHTPSLYRIEIMCLKLHKCVDLAATYKATGRIPTAAAAAAASTRTFQITVWTHLNNSPASLRRLTPYTPPW